jgi:putative ABC transport system ATP-binding protein
MEPLIRMEGIKKVFYTDEVETHALADVHLEIRPGEYIAIAGPSGCGKTTLLSILGLLDTPTDGTYTLGGELVSNLSAADRARIRNRQIGFIFQAFNLIGDLTVYENVELPLTYRGMSSAERKRRVAEALERVQMGHRMKHYPSQLSGGQQQRVAVARAVAGDPAILLADEPTGNLDSVNGEAVMGLLQELHKGGATICMVTHDPRYAAHAERGIHLFDGKVADEELVASHYLGRLRSHDCWCFLREAWGTSSSVGGPVSRTGQPTPVSSTQPWHQVPSSSTQQPARATPQPAHNNGPRDVAIPLRRGARRD